MSTTNNIGWNFHNSYTHLPELFYTTTMPTPAENPTLIFCNQRLASSLGLDSNKLKEKEGVEILSGNSVPKGSMNIAQAYAGHQFGNFTNLGDGRAIMIGEHITPENKRFDIQLKGAGRTDYSRGGDGLATLGSMLREYVISEAMHALGIPTSRGLAVIKSDDTVFREDILSRGILTRVAGSHLRVGTFQYAAAQGDKNALQELADYAINRHYSELKGKPSPYLSLLEQVMNRQAALVAKWQLVGFIHGVMNTDNMTISGETIDYGPCAFMNTYSLDTVFSSIDRNGRYKYGNQPAMAQWNLTRFAETLIPLIDANQENAIHQAGSVIKQFFPVFNDFWLNGMRGKLGLFGREKEDYNLVVDLLHAMGKYKADYTDTFLALTHDNREGMVLFASEEFLQWYERWSERIDRQQKTKNERQELMRHHNPALIPRNHLVENAIDAAVNKDNYVEMKQLIEALSDPFAHTSKQAAYAKVPVPQEPYQTFCGT